MAKMLHPDIYRVFTHDRLLHTRLSPGLPLYLFCHYGTTGVPSQSVGPEFGARHSIPLSLLLSIARSSSCMLFSGTCSLFMRNTKVGAGHSSYSLLPSFLFFFFVLQTWCRKIKQARGGKAIHLLINECCERASERSSGRVRLQGMQEMQMRMQQRMR